MPQNKSKAPLDHLGPEECARVLNELLKRHQDLRREANAGTLP